MKLSQHFVSDQEGLKLQNTWKVDANIWWEIVTWPPLLCSPGELSENVIVIEIEWLNQKLWSVKWPILVDFAMTSN